MENSSLPKKSHKIDSEKPVPKIKIFQKNLINFAKIGICPDLITQRYPFNWKISMSVLLVFIADYSFFSYFFREAETFNEYTQSIYFCSVAVAISIVYVMTILDVKTLFKFIEDLENLINTSFEFCASQSIFGKTSQLIEKLTEILFILGVDVIMLTPIPWIIFAYFIYFTTDSGAKAFELPIPMWFPFDWKTPRGILVAIAFMWQMLVLLMVFFVDMATFAIGSYLIAISGSKCLNDVLHRITQTVEDKSTRKHVFKPLVEFIEISSKVNRLIDNFSNIFEPILMVLFAWNLVTICGAIIMIQLEIMNHSDNALELLIISVQAFYSFGTLFVACELGQRMTLAYVECSDEVELLKWYLFPARVKRLLPMIISFTQKPVVLRCFGSTAVERETFKYIVNTACSYSTMLRQFYN